MLTHISNNYLGSSVHADLAEALSKRNVHEQFVYCPLQKKFKENPSIKKVNGVNVDSPRVFNQIVRYFPLLKVVWSFIVFLVVIRKNDVKPSFILAHNLWSDGMVAWLYYKLTGTPYTVSIRNTDINIFLPKLPHYRFFFKKILTSCRGVVFVNNAYLSRLKIEYPSVYKSISNYSVIFNGINDEWFDLLSGLNLNFRELKVSFVGSFLENKNIKNSLLAIQEIRRKGVNLKYTAIGGSESDFLAVSGLTKIPNWVTVVPRTTNRQKIAQHLQDSRVFLMPSFRETFGLVYIEALTQGCCVIYSKGEGIDGLFNEPEVRSVDPNSVHNISSVLHELIESYPEGVCPGKIKEMTSVFSWDIIASQYLDVINSNSS